MSLTSLSRSLGCVHLNRSQSKVVVAVTASARAAVRGAAEALVAEERAAAVWVAEEREEAASVPEVMEEAVDLEAPLAAVVARSISPPKSERSLRMC